MERFGLCSSWCGSSCGPEPFGRFRRRLGEGSKAPILVGEEGGREVGAVQSGTGVFGLARVRVVAADGRTSDGRCHTRVTLAAILRSSVEAKGSALCRVDVERGGFVTKAAGQRGSHVGGNAGVPRSTWTPRGESFLFSLRVGHFRTWRSRKPLLGSPGGCDWGWAERSSWQLEVREASTWYAKGALLRGQNIGPGISVPRLGGRTTRLLCGRPSSEGRLRCGPVTSVLIWPRIIFWAAFFVARGLLEVGQLPR